MRTFLSSLYTFGAVNENVLTGDVALLTQPPVQVQVTNLADNPEKGSIPNSLAHCSVLV